MSKQFAKKKNSTQDGDELRSIFKIIMIQEQQKNQDTGKIPEFIDKMNENEGKNKLFERVREEKKSVDVVQMKTNCTLSLWK